MMTMFRTRTKHIKLFLTFETNEKRRINEAELCCRGNLETKILFSQKRQSRFHIKNVLYNLKPSHFCQDIHIELFYKLE